MDLHATELSPAGSSSRDPIGYEDGLNSYQFLVSGPFTYLDPLGLLKKPKSGPGSAGGGKDGRSLCGPGWDLVSVPPKDPSDEMSPGWSPKTIIKGSLYEFSYYETSYEAAGLEAKSNECGGGISDSFTLTFTKDFSLDFGIDVYGFFSVGGGCSSGEGKEVSKNVELAGKPCYQYKAVGVVERIRIRHEQWYVHPERLRSVKYGDQGYFPRINFVVCRSRCDDCCEDDPTPGSPEPSLAP